MLRQAPQFISQITKRLPLRIVLTVPFVLQVLAATGLVGYLSIRNGQKAVNDLALQLQQQVSARVDQHLNSYLVLPHQINQLNLEAIQRGQLDLKNLNESGRYFWKQAQIFKNFSFIGYALQDNTNVGAGRWLKGQDLVITYHPGGSTKDYTYTADNQGNRTKQVLTADYDALTDAWYKETVKAGKPLWSRVSVAEGFGSHGYIYASANVPIYNQKHQLLGALGTDLLLSDINTFLKGIKVSPLGKIFIMERNGLLIANSGSFPTYKLINNTETQRINALESDSPQIRTAAQYLKQKFGTFETIRSSQQLEFVSSTLESHSSMLGGQQNRQFISVMPWQDRYGLDWLVVVLVPEADFMEQINTNTNTTIFLCVLAIAVSVMLGIFTAEWVSRPILRINQAAKAIAGGDFVQTIALKRRDELGELSHSFDRMAAQLQTSFSELKDLNTALSASEQRLASYNQVLEQQVQQRTQELSQTLQQLQSAQQEIIQSEKMAALGQLVAGIAHEINSPLGAIQASVSNISTALDQLLLEFPPLLQTLSPVHQTSFFTLIEWARQPRDLLPPRVERQLRRTIQQTLTEQGIEEAELAAQSLSRMGFTSSLDPILPLLQIPNTLDLLGAAHHLSTIQHNSQNTQMAVEKSSRIVYALKAFVRQDGSTQPIRASVVDSIETVLTLYQHHCQNGIEMIKSIAPVPDILCYPDDLAQVWSNLIGNAVQSMNYRGRLEIGVNVQNQNVVVEIIDCGIGIPLNIQDKVFEPFFTTKPSGEGSGLGLSIVKKIVDKHHGKVELESMAGATVFRVWLPLDPEPLALQL